MALATVIFGLLALASLTSVLAGRPWTSVLARRTTERSAWRHPLFRETNMVLSLGWTALFAITAFSAWLPGGQAWFLIMTVVNTGAGALSPWLGKTYAAWRAPAHDH